MGKGGLGRGAVWGDSHGWAAQRRDLGSHCGAVLWGEGIVHLEKQQERKDTQIRMIPDMDGVEIWAVFL